jgi:hypothetical protein
MNISNKYKIRNSIWIDSEIFYSDAYREISSSASCINTLLRCLQKRKWETLKAGKKRKIIFNDDGFIFPYAEAKALGICGKTMHWKNLIRLVDVGFLDLVHQGGWYRKHEKTSDYSVYKFSERWKKFGTAEFVEVHKEKVLPEHFHIRENIKRRQERPKVKSNFTIVNTSCSLS